MKKIIFIMLITVLLTGKSYAENNTNTTWASKLNGKVLYCDIVNVTDHEFYLEDKVSLIFLKDQVSTIFSEPLLPLVKSIKYEATNVEGIYIHNTQNDTYSFSGTFYSKALMFKLNLTDKNKQKKVLSLEFQLVNCVENPTLH